MFELSFLNTGLLIFAAATVLPLIIWLLAKRKPHQVVFSTLRFIKLSKDQQKNRTKLNNIILLIIRMLIILLVVLSAARPLLRSERLKPAKKHPPTAIAILLDTSYSMDYLLDSKAWLDRAKDALKVINKRCTPQDRVILVSSSESWNALHAQIYSAAIPEDLIDQLSITHQALPLDKMVELAEEKLKDSQLPNREIYLLSDMQQPELTYKPEYPINVIPLAAEPSFENLSVSAATPVPQLVERSRLQSIRYEIINHGNSERKDVLIKAVVNDTKVAEKFISLPPNQSISDVISFDIRTDGWQQGFIEVLDDRLIHDNRSYFAFSYFMNPRIAVISEQNTIPASLSSMLKVYGGDKGKLEILSPASLNLDVLRNYNLILVYAPGSLNLRLREILSALAQRQTGVLYVLGKELSAEWKAYFQTTFGIGINAFSSNEQSLSFVNKYHYITSLLRLEQIRQLNVTDYWKAEGKSSSNTLLSAGNDPLALSSGSSVLWLWDIGSAKNRFFIDPAYAVFAYRSFQFLGNAVQDSQSKNIGESIISKSLKLPDGTNLDLFNRSHIISEPGVYQSLSSTGETSYIAVNPDISESTYKAADYGKNKAFRILPNAWQNHLFFTRMGHDLWKLLLIIAFILILVEIIIVKIEEAKPKTGAPPS